MDIIQAGWIDDLYSYCEYCPSQGFRKTYLPYSIEVTGNPAHICVKCAQEHNVVGWFDSKDEYIRALLKLKEDT